MITKTVIKKIDISTKQLGTKRNKLSNTPIPLLEHPAPVNINHVIQALRKIKTETTPVNSLILTIKTIQILIQHNPKLTEDVEHITKSLYDEFEIAYEIYHHRYFEYLNYYSIVQLLDLMKIKEDTRLELITSISMCKDIKKNEDGLFGCVGSLKWVHKSFFNEVLKLDIYLTALQI